MSSDDPETLSPEEEAVMREVLESRLEKYKGIAPPDALATMREVGAEGLRTHPLLRSLVKRLAAARRAAPDRSGDLPEGKNGAQGGSGGAEGSA
jgi:hypothetical protein